LYPSTGVAVVVEVRFSVEEKDQRSNLRAKNTGKQTETSFWPEKAAGCHRLASHIFCTYSNGHANFSKTLYLSPP